MLTTTDHTGFSDDEMRGQFISVFIEIESQLKDIIVKSLSDEIRVQNRIKGILLHGAGSSQIINQFENLLNLSNRSKNEKRLIEQLKTFNTTRNLFAHSRILKTENNYIFLRDDKKENIPSLKPIPEQQLIENCMEMMKVSLELKKLCESLASRIRKAIDSEWAP